MADVSASIKYLLEALRTPAANASVTPQTGPDAGAPRQSGPAGLGPIEQRRDGYRLYLQEAKSNGEHPMSYEQWFSSQTPMSQ